MSQLSSPAPSCDHGTGLATFSLRSRSLGTSVDQGTGLATSSPRSRSLRTSSTAPSCTQGLGLETSEALSLRLQNLGTSESSTKSLRRPSPAEDKSVSHARIYIAPDSGLLISPGQAGGVGMISFAGVGIATAEATADKTASAERSLMVSDGGFDVFNCYILS
jgi:hypothetical protein